MLKDALPCPFCGKSDCGFKKMELPHRTDRAFNYPGTSVVCNECGGCGSVAIVMNNDAEEQRVALNLWNTRVMPWSD